MPDFYGFRGVYKYRGIFKWGKSVTFQYFWTGI